MVLSQAGFAQAPPPKSDSIQAIATYQGADRAQRILEGAKREGSLTLYTSLDGETSAKVEADFEKRYGIKLNLWRASSEDIVQRAITESRAGRHDFDAIETDGPSMEAIQREGLLQKVQAPYFKDIIPQAIIPHHEWVADRLNVFVQGYNTNAIKKADLPKTFADLLDPKWKGKLTVEMGDYDWFLTVVNNMGEKQGLKYFRDLVAKNGVSVRKGHTLIAQLLKSGEVQFALSEYSFNIVQGIEEGAPVNWLSLGPLIARPNGVGVSKDAPHPYAAMLFYDYLLTDGQQLLKDRDIVTVSKKIVSPILKDHDIQFIDSAKILDESDKWQALFNNIFIDNAK